MAEVTGVAKVIANLLAVGEKIEAEMETRMARLTAYMTEGIKYDHRWRPDRPHTEGTTMGYLIQRGASEIVAKVSVDQDAGIFLEVAREGKWAWMWPWMMDHLGDIAAILGTPAEMLKVLPADEAMLYAAMKEAEEEATVNHMYADAETRRGETRASRGYYLRNGYDRSLFEE